MEDFFKKCLGFNEMITPVIIRVVYWLLLIGVVIGSVMTMFNSFLTGLLSLIAGIVAVRIYCELTILFFNIYQQVKRIADNLEEKNRQP